MGLFNLSNLRKFALEFFGTFRNILGALTLLSVSLTQTAQADDLAKFESLVVQHVIEVYSEGWDNGQFLMPESDVWDLQLASNDPKYCLATITGLASAPSPRGTALHKFWVCITEPISGQFEAEIIDDIILAEAD